MFDILFMIILLFTGNLGVDIDIEVQNSSSACHDGFREGIDEYGFTGTIGPNILNYIRSGWDLAIDLETAAADSTTFIQLCSVFIGRDPSFRCAENLTDECECDKYNATSNTAHFIVKSKANAQYSHGQIRAFWMHGENKTRIYSIKNKTLPAIYGVTKADLSLSVNGIKTACPGTVNVFKTNTYEIRLCCSNTAMPCYPVLGFNGRTTFGDQSPCAIYTFSETSVMDKQEYNVTQSYFVCTRDVLVPRSSCKLQINITEPPEEPSGAISIYWIVLPIVIVVCCIIGVIILFVCCKWKQEDETTTNDGTKNDYSR